MKEPKHWGITHVDIEVVCEKVTSIESFDSDEVHLFLKKVRVKDLRRALEPNSIVQTNSEEADSE